MANDDRAEPGRRAARRGQGLHGPGQPSVRTLRPMQATLDESYKGTRVVADEDADGILGDPEGVVWLYSAGQRIAQVQLTGTNTVSGTYRRGDEDIHLEWRRWTLDSLRWTHRSALLFLQGASVQQLIGERFIVLKASPVRPYVPGFGLRRVVLAEVFTSPEMSRLELFGLLLPEAGT